MAEARLEVRGTSPEERLKRLRELEGVIRQGKEVFLEVGRALEEIRNRELYNPPYKSFAAYCEAELEFPRRTAYRYMAWARADEKLGPIGHSIENEAQARQIARLEDDPDAAREVWEQVGAANGGRHPSKALEAAVDRKLRRVALPEKLDYDVGEEVVERSGRINEKYPEDFDPKHLAAAEKAARRTKNEREKAEARAARPPLVGTGARGIEIHHCEIGDLGEKVEDKSVDLILTDPPYSEEHLPLFSALGEFAKAKLKPTGLLVTYLGSYHLPHALNRVMAHVPWYWQMVVEHREKEAAHNKGYSLDHKHVGVFGEPGPEFARTQRPGMFGGGGGDKTHHEWGQPAAEAVHLMKTHSEPFDLVVDPFLGGGTTAVAAKRLGRRCIAGEKEWDFYQEALARVRAEPGPAREPGRVAASAPPRGDEALPPRARALNEWERLALILESLDGTTGAVAVLRPRDIP